MLLRILIVMFLFFSSMNNCWAQKYSAILNKKVVNLEVADTLAKRQQGLIDRKYMPDNKGMLFVFQKNDYVDFWMKNMEIPLDIIFIYNEKIVKIIKKVPICEEDPCPVYSSTFKINKVIEVKAGFCDKYKIKEGQKVQIVKN